MKECLDKSGLQYFYEKLCKIFLRKDQQAVFVLTSQGIEEALGYTPVSNRLYSTDIDNIKKNIIQFNNDLKKVTSVTNSTGIAIDTLKAEIAQWADQIDTVNGEITNVTRTLSAQSGKIQDIASKYYQLGDRVTVAENTIDVNAGYIKSVVSQVRENRESITEIKQWIDENQTGFDISAEIKKGTDQAKAEIMGIIFEDPNDPTKLNSRIKVSADDIQVDGQNIDLSGNVTFQGLENSVNGVNGKVDELNTKLFGETTISGGLIKTDLINTEELKVKHLDGATGSFSGSLTASDISASTINGGTITGQIDGTANISTSGTFTGDIVARSITLGDNGVTYNNWESLKSDINISDAQIENVISNKFNENVVTVNKLASAINNLSYSELTTIGNGVTAALSNYATTSNLTQLRTDLTTLLSGKVGSDEINGIVDEIVQNRTNELVIPTITKDQDGVLHISVSGSEYKAYEQTTSDGKYVVYGTSGSAEDTENGTYFILGKDGLLKANNAIIHGVIVATSGHFTGEVTAESGNIGGWTIATETIDGEQRNVLKSNYSYINEDNFANGSIGTINLVCGRGLYLSTDSSAGGVKGRTWYDTKLQNIGLSINKKSQDEQMTTKYGAMITYEKFEMSKRESRRSMTSETTIETSIISAQFNSDGSGQLANNGISWDTNGSVTVNTSGMSEGFKFIGSEQSNATNYTVINGNNASLNSEDGHIYLTPNNLEIQGSDASASKFFANNSFITVGQTNSDSQASGTYSKLESNGISFCNNANNQTRVVLAQCSEGGKFDIIRLNQSSTGQLTDPVYYAKFDNRRGSIGSTISWDSSKPQLNILNNIIQFDTSQNQPKILFNDGLYTCLYYDGGTEDKKFGMNNGSSRIELTSLSTRKSKIVMDTGNTGITINETTNSITSTSNITTASDINIKDIISEDTCFTVDNIADAPFFDYTYKKDESKNVQIGTSAQYWQTVCPNSVKANEDGILGLNYQGVALGSAICLAKKIKEQQSEIDELKSQIAELKTLINSK